MKLTTLLFVLMLGVRRVETTSLPSVRKLPVVAELPDPFVRADGTRVSTKEQWQAQRTELLRLVLHYQYGSLPPVPHSIEAVSAPVKHLQTMRATQQHVVLRMGLDQAVATPLILTIPEGTGPFPAIVRGDLCWGRVDRRVVADIVRRGYLLADFDREGLAHDGVRRNGVYLAHPDYDGGRLAVWAWGFHRVVDFLHTLDTVDHQRIIVTGHSRGGKAALLAGATDERIALTAPNNSGCGGAGCYRLQGKGSEDIAKILRTYPYWFHSRLKGFIGHVKRLPFDQHTVKALVAPRALLSTEAFGDGGRNPMGTQQTYLAAREVFAFLGVASRIGLYFRAGGHEHSAQDWATLLDFADWQLRGKNVFNRVPFPDVPRGYTWTAPDSTKSDDADHL